MQNDKSLDKDQYIQNRYKAAIGYYWNASKTNKRWYKITRSLTVILGAMVTLIASLSSSTLFADGSVAKGLLAVGTPALAATLTIIAGFSQSFQWGSAWQNMVLTAQQLQKEFDSYLVTSPEKRDFQSEAAKLNEFILIESEGFFDRMLGGGKAAGKPQATNNGEAEEAG